MAEHEDAESVMSQVKLAAAYKAAGDVVVSGALRLLG